MEEIFRKELKVDGSVTDTSVPDEPEDCASEQGQKKGEAIYIVPVYMDTCMGFSY